MFCFSYDFLSYECKLVFVLPGVVLTIFGETVPELSLLLMVFEDRLPKLMSSDTLNQKKHLFILLCPVT